MCSFLYSSKKTEKNIDDLNYYLKFRGPDHTEVKIIQNNLFIHNLLSITGSFSCQPYIKDDIVAMYNGEIYNYKNFGDYRSDGECLIPLYEECGSDFIKKLDGEFAICIVDYKNQKIIISSDIFKTKPLFFALDDNDFGCSTYKTPLKKLEYKNIEKVEPNSIYVFCLKTKKLLEKKQIYEFDLIQKKDSFSDWISSFTDSIKKRISNVNKKIFIGLSSGYDSGLIYNELINLNCEFDAYTILGAENEEILNERLKLKPNNVNHFKLNKNDGDYVLSHLYIKNKTEDFYYTIKSDTSDYNEFDASIVDDTASCYFATICRKASRNGYRVCLSGTGADEIISDYGFNGEKKYPHSNFGGKFPSDLKTIFPWASFYGSTLESYIAKEEYVGGSYGVEMRYPFLDKNVVQEFLWLDHNLKNKSYKAPIGYYFDKIKFPYENSVKRGFQ
jgi:asparagine synthase (glutamine-hydrolysing)